MPFPSCLYSPSLLTFLTQVFPYYRRVIYCLRDNSFKMSTTYLSVYDLLRIVHTYESQTLLAEERKDNCIQGVPRCPVCLIPWPLVILC